jgi:hypothetical protein
MQAETTLHRRKTRWPRCATTLPGEDRANLRKAIDFQWDRRRSRAVIDSTLI